ncbi:MAG: glycosyltransferase family 39 protein [Anaerolineae bacterium]
MSKPQPRALFVMVAVLLAAAFLRLVAWRDAPPGLRYDEMTVVYEADEIRAGARPIYMDGSAEEALFHYFFAATQDLIGAHEFALRWLSAAFGLIAVAATYALGRRLFNVRVGVLAALLAAASFWALMYSRIGLRIIALPAFVTLAMMVLWQGWLHARRRDFVIAGVLFGLSAYTYSATRMLPLVLVAFLAYLLIFNRPQLRLHGGHILLTLLIALAIARRWRSTSLRYPLPNDASARWRVRWMHYSAAKCDR